MSNNMKHKRSTLSTDGYNDSFLCGLNSSCNAGISDSYFSLRLICFLDKKKRKTISDGDTANLGTRVKRGRLPKEVTPFDCDLRVKSIRRLRLRIRDFIFFFISWAFLSVFDGKLSL